MIEHFQVKLVESYMLAPTVRHLAFERADGAPFAFVPGQFIQVHFHYDDGKPTKRSYSVGTPVDGSGKAQRLELAVSYVEGGAATKLFERLQAGEEVDASGPFGRFCLMDDDANQRYLLIATGTGVAPYRAMLPHIEKLIAEKDRRFVLLYGARTEQELLYGEEFEAFAKSHPGFVFHPCFSRGARATPRPHDRQGHVQDALPEIAPDPEHDIAYLCGNPDMVDATFTALKELGLPIKHIRREKYVSSR
ncbi:MAG TPA: FAD-binding oxidoreductase [Rhodanobacteraceae bacterium]|jgi:ferredoxin-NADP reductase|nr:FAD-binding oxidoreductase [Rhodanobacteraceae bacterium]